MVQNYTLLSEKRMVFVLLFPPLKASNNGYLMSHIMSINRESIAQAV
jgi:hypothetical protein